ncbi:MAG TPA: GNAT family N-acetyltransferase [Terriglobales bacterium]|nr:GNAT family N-acetyltransferase [Terriglobales bacterium]
MVIRKATTKDLESIGLLWQEFMDFHKERDPIFARSTEGHEHFKEFIAGHLEKDSSLVLIAEQDGAAIGYCLAMLSKYPPVFEAKEYGTIYDLAVTQKFRRAGIGEKMYKVAEKWFFEHGVHRIELRVAVSNEVSTTFWRKMGFKPHVEVLFKKI